MVAFDLVLRLLWERCHVAPVPEPTQNRIERLAAPDNFMCVELEVDQATRRDHRFVHAPVGDAKEWSIWQLFEVVMRLDCRKERANAALGLRCPKDRKCKASAWLEHSTDFLEDHRRARKVMDHKIAHNRIKRAGFEGELLRVGFLERDTGELPASDSNHLGGKVHARDDRPSLGERMGT